MIYNRLIVNNFKEIFFDMEGLAPLRVAEQRGVLQFSHYKFIQKHGREIVIQNYG